MCNGTPFGDFSGELLCLRCTIVQRQRTRGHTSRWMRCGRLLATWLIIRHLLSMAKTFFCVFLRPVRGLSPRRGPRPAGHGRGLGRVPSQLLLWQSGSTHTPIVRPINDPTDHWLDQTPNCLPLEDLHYAEVFAVSYSFNTDDPPLWSGLLSRSTRAAALREPGGFTSSITETTTPLNIVGIHSLMRAAV